MDAPTVEHLVADAGAFIKNAALRLIGRTIYTLPEVVNEIRDKPTRQRLHVTPYDLKFRQPGTDDIRIVTEFAKKTGDYSSLSAVDIKVLALTYHLEKENVGTDHIKVTANRDIQWHSSTRLLENPTEITGFYLKDKSKTSSRKTSECSTATGKSESEQQIDQSENSGEPNVTDSNIADDNLETHNITEIGDVKNEDVEIKLDDLKISNVDENVNSEVDLKESQISNEIQVSESDITDNLETIEDKNNLNESENTPIFSNQQNRVKKEGDILADDLIAAEESESETESESDDDGGGWITPQNIASVKENMGSVSKEESTIAVGCLTTDFAMQNVLIQMGLNVVAVDGMLIKRAKSYVLRCYACRRITSVMTKQFCGNCGNATLKRIAMTVEADGSIRYFLSRRKPISTRGMKHNLPAPKGGKHANNPILFEDQPMPQQRPSRKALAKMNVLEADYVAGTSPFMTHDTTSRSAQLGIRAGGKGRQRPRGRRK